MTPAGPIFVIELFPETDRRLVELLGSLAADDWLKPAAGPSWQVRDVAAHLLDGNLRRLSLGRDALDPPQPAEPIREYSDLVDYLNDLNAQWVTAARRLSPRVLMDLLESTGRQVYEFFSSLDPFDDAMFPVAWAGDVTSPIWFDIARELTEKWHHQQQIRDAVGAPPLTDKEHLFPVLDTFLRGLPHAYRDVDAREGTMVGVRILGPAGGDWALVAHGDCWTLYEGSPENASATIEIDQNDAWRLFTKGLTPDEARPRASIAGELGLAEPLFGLVSIMG